jgi:hypothetical protein
VPFVLIDRPLNVAKPVLVLTATIVVPLSTPPGPALFWMARVTFCAVPVTVFPFASSRVTTGCVVQVVPPVPPPGCVVKTNCDAAPGENTMLPLVTGVKLVSPAVAVAVSVIVSDFE